MCIRWKGSVLMDLDKHYITMYMYMYTFSVNNVHVHTFHLKMRLLYTKEYVHMFYDRHIKCLYTMKLLYTLVCIHPEKLFNYDY